MGGFWDRKGENEIDLIAANELDRTIEFIEIKRNTSRIDIKVLEAKSVQFMQAHPQCKGYRLSCRGLSMDDM